MRTQKPVTVNESAELLQAFVIVEFFSDISKRRNWVAHLSVHDGVQCLRRVELFKVGNSQRRAAVFNGAGKVKLMSIEHELLRSLDFTETIEEYALAIGCK